MSQRLQREIRKNFLNVVYAKETDFEAFVGDGGGTIEVPGHADAWYVRPVGSGLPVVVKRGAAPKVDGLRVRIGRDFDDGRRGRRGHLQIRGVLNSSLDTTTSVEAHGGEHLIGGGDPIYIDTVQVVNGLVYASTGMTVTINPGWAIIDETPVHFDQGALDLTGEIPGSGALYGLVRVDSAGTIDFQAGSAATSFVDLGWDDVPQIGEGYAALAIVRLYDGQTELSRWYANPDVIDIRFAPRSVFSLTNLLDVTIDAPGDGELLVYDAIYTNEWINATPGEVNISMYGHTHVEADITDLDHDAVKLQGRNLASDAPAAGQGVVWNDDLAQWEPGDVGNTSITGLPETGWVEAGETWDYEGADDPTYTFTVDGDKEGKYTPGMRVKLSQVTGGTKYFIITAVEYNDYDATTITIYGGTDYDLDNEAISNPYYSVCKAPLAFPLDPDKWTEETTSASDVSQATPTANTWYNLGTLSLTIPIGCWKVSYKVNMQTSDSAASAWTMFVTLSTANNTQSDAELTASQLIGNALNLRTPVYVEKNLNLSAKAAYYLNAKTSSSGLDVMYFVGTQGTTIIRAVCAYL